jgi:hypothetical protein
MQIFRVNRLPLFQAPDTATDPNPPVDPAVAAAAAASAAVDPANPPAAVDPPADPVVDPAAPAADPAGPGERVHGNKGRKPWYLDRISEETAARQAAEQRAADALELANRLQNQRAADPADPARAVVPPADEPAIERRAREIAEQTRNQEKISSVIAAGVSKYDDWDDRMATLNAAGAASAAFALDVYTADPANAHEILHALADDPTKASRLARLDPRTRMVELLKMSPAIKAAPNAASSTAPALPRNVSRAPAPPPAIDPGATQTVDWRTDKNISDSEWSKRWDEEQRQKQAARRR